MKKLWLLLLVIAPLTTWSQSSLFYIGAPGEYVSRGQTRLITSEDGASFYVMPGPSTGKGLYLNIGQGQETWMIAFEAFDRSPLTTGHYADALRWPFNRWPFGERNPGMDFSIDGRGNNRLTGEFDVLEVSYEDGQLRSAAIDFIQFSEGIPDRWIVGAIRYNSALPITIPEPATLTIFAAGISFMYMRWRRM